MLASPELLADYQLVADLLENHAAVTFLNKDQAAVLHAVLTNTFDIDREQIPADVFEAEVASVLAILRNAGAQVPERAPRDLCRTWVDGRWLRLLPTAEGGEVYTRTAESHEALGYLRDLTAPRRGTAVSDVPRFLSQVEDLASRLSGNTEQRAELLRRRIALLEEELSRLKDGVEDTATFDEFVAGHDSIVAMLSAIDLGFRHVTEQLWRVQKRMLDDIALNNPDPVAQMQVGENAWQELVTTPEGRAVDDALRILLDPNARAMLSKHVSQVLTHDYAQTLQPWERRAFGNLAALLHSHVGPLVDANRRGNLELNIAFRKQAVRHIEHEGYDEAIRRARRVLRDYTGRAIPDHVLPRLTRLDLGSAPGRLPDVVAPADPTPLEDMDDSEAAPPTAQEIARWRGPHMDQVRAHVEETLSTLDQPLTIGELWSLAPEHLRRNVELVAYYFYAHEVSETGRAVYQADREESVLTVAPDGQLVPFDIGRIVIYPDWFVQTPAEEPAHA